MKKCLIVILLLIGRGAYAFQLIDTGNIAIHISAKPPMDERYWYDIYKANDRIKIVSSYEYSYQREPVRVIKDSILIDAKKSTSYEALLKAINNTSVQELENEDANKGWFAFNGTHFEFKIVSALGVREALSYFPREAAQPLLYKLIEQTAAIYRDNRPVRPTDVYDIVIQIKARPIFLNMAPYWVEIYRDKENIKIVYSIQILQGYNYTPSGINKDSVILNRQKAESFDSLLNRVDKASVTELENREHERQVLDGEYFNFTIISESQSKSAFAHSPDKSSNPLLNELLEKAFAIYRDKKPTTAWVKEKTFGY